MPGLTKDKPHQLMGFMAYDTTIMCDLARGLSGNGALMVVRGMISCINIFCFLSFCFWLFLAVQILELFIEQLDLLVSCRYKFIRQLS
jgi:hypothetical protein